MKHFCLVFLLVIFCGFSFAQPCFPNGISLVKQDQIDSFSTNYPDCTEIKGDLNLGHFMSGFGLYDLSGIAQITAVGGDLMIANTELINLTGLENLKSVGGALTIRSNWDLQTIDALSNLESVGGQYMIIGYNYALEDLKAFEYTDFQLSHVSITYNNTLTDLDGLQSIKSVNGDLAITDNAGLTSLLGLDSLKSVSNYLAISRNAALTEITSLNIDTVGELRVVNNDTLTNLEGLNNVDLSSTNFLLILRNDLLSVCNIPSICNYIENGGDARIEDNADGCNSVEEVTALCLVANDSVEFDDDISIFPNPNAGTFRIEGISKTIYTIHNTAGQLIEKGEVMNEGLIDISSEDSGIYFISIMINDRLVKKRILKM